MKLSKILNEEITATELTEPDVLMFVDESSIYWVSKDGYYVWMSDHDGISGYTNETHKIEDRRYSEKSTEGVGQTGVYLLNQNFNSPFHVSDFEKRIGEINSIVN